MEVVIYFEVVGMKFPQISRISVVHARSFSIFQPIADLRLMVAFARPPIVLSPMAYSSHSFFETFNLFSRLATCLCDGTCHRLHKVRYIILYTWNSMPYLPLEVPPYNKA